MFFIRTTVVTSWRSEVNAIAFAEKLKKDEAEYNAYPRKLSYFNASLFEHAFSRKP